MNFKKWLEHDLKSMTYNSEELKNYIDPDLIWRNRTPIKNSGGNIVAFIYTTDHEMLYSDKYNDTHYDIAHNYSIKHHNGKNLHGRLGAINNKIYVSFWENKPEILNTLLKPCLKPCLKQLLDDNLIKADRDLISISGLGTVPISQIPDMFKDPSQEEKERQELMRKLHLMNPQQKKNTMAKLGLASGYKKSPWQSASDELGITSPGKRIWALNSETFRT